MRKFISVALFISLVSCINYPEKKNIQLFKGQKENSYVTTSYSLSNSLGAFKPWQYLLLGLSSIANVSLAGADVLLEKNDDSWMAQNLYSEPEHLNYYDDHRNSRRMLSNTWEWNTGDYALYKQGYEMRVNTYTSSSQGAPANTGLLNGGLVVVWTSANQDGSSNGIYGQIFDDSGNKLGSEFRVNSRTLDDQSASAVTTLLDGNFVVSWRSNVQDGSSWGVYAQIFDPDGNKVGNELQVNTYYSGEQRDPAIFYLLTGGFVITWHSYGQDGSSWGVYGQRFDRLGNKLGSEFRINTRTIDDQSLPTVTTLLDGNFVITWRSLPQDGSSWGVYAQIFDPDGNKAGNELQVNTYYNNEQREPTISYLNTGGFVIAWQSYTQDGSSWGIYGQRFDRLGNKLGSEFRINTRTLDDQSLPFVATLLDGNFVVTWRSNAQDGSSWGIHGQMYDSDGNRIGTEFQVNDYYNSEQNSPNIASLADGGFSIVWQSYGQDGSYSGVYMQMYDIWALTQSPTTSTHIPTMYPILSPTMYPSLIPSNTPSEGPTVGEEIFTSMMITDNPSKYPSVSLTHSSINISYFDQNSGQNTEKGDDASWSPENTGIVIGVSSGVCILGFLGYYLWRSKKIANRVNSSDNRVSHQPVPSVDAESVPLDHVNISNSTYVTSSATPGEQTPAPITIFKSKSEDYHAQANQYSKIQNTNRLINKLIEEGKSQVSSGDDHELYEKLEKEEESSSEDQDTDSLEATSKKE